LYIRIFKDSWLQ